MAFKATRKPTIKTKVKPDEPDVSVVPQPTLKIEDLVGEVGEKHDVPVDQFVQPKVASTSPVSSPVTPVPLQRRDYDGSGRRFSGGDYRGGGQGGNRRFSGGDYRGGGPGGNRRFGGGYGNNQGGYRRPPDRNFREGFVDRPRQDFVDTPFTLDVNVPTETVRGILDTMPDGHGFLRPKYTPSEKDVYISQSQIRRFLLRNGDMVEGQARAPKENERYYGLLKVEKVNELAAEMMEKRPKFEDLVPIYPNTLLKLETGKLPLSTRMIDLLAPIGFGQRGLIVSPPKAGKTTVLKELAAGIAENYPQVHLMAVLIGERPEEVTDIMRSVKGEVYASNFDEAPDHQTRVAEVALDRAKRLIEMGHDVVILLDSITRLARAYNMVVNPSGRTLTGGFDPAALYPAKKFLGAARCNEPFITPEEQAANLTGERPKLNRATEGGSLTIIGTALIETGSRMDDLIYEEFKGTGNMELHLSRSLQERRVFPAIDVGKSGTRHDELLLGEESMKRIITLRHMLTLLSDDERTLMLIDKMSKIESNKEFLDVLGKD